MKNNQKGFSTLLGLLLFIFLAGGGLYLYSEKVSKEMPEVNSVSTTTQNIQSTSSNGSAISDTATKTIQFPFPSVPTILLTNCKMGGCGWEKILNIENIKTDMYGELRKMTVTEVGMSGHGYNEDYPLEYNENIPIEWRVSPFDVYFLCSKEHPLYIFKFKEDETSPYSVMRLNIVNPFGFEVSAVNKYILACHGINQQKSINEKMSALGYKHFEDTYNFEINSIEELYKQFK